MQREKQYIIITLEDEITQTKVIIIYIVFHAAYKI